MYRGRIAKAVLEAGSKRGRVAEVLWFYMWIAYILKVVLLRFCNGTGVTEARKF